eukprot:TRINITY_DN8474_c0_g1_i2.p1 TRINITY_DN8474_c0_g1~~TRINITY_DN8474_c0_g1_i2.p1  ORF type:complete len:190 (-),score=41.62 TRINITY_DN8474_c0_g1_i2:64-633(-)
MKVLMIHGYTQNAEVFSCRTSNLRRKALKIPGESKPEFMFAQSPLQIPPELSSSQSECTDQRAWYLPHSLSQSSTRPVQSTQYLHWEQPLDELRELVAQHGPFAGVVAFSQGGVPAAVLLAEMPESFRFGLFVSCFAPLDPEVRGLVTRVCVPTMHVLGTADEFVDNERSMELAGLLSLIHISEPTRPY